MTRQSLGRTAFAAVSAALLACGDSGRAPAPPDSAGAASATTKQSPDTVTFPEGFQGRVFADSLGQARHIAARANGDLYVNTQRSPYDTALRVPPGGFLVALRDTNQDGKADRVQRFGSEKGNGGTGIALFKEHLYVEAGPAILRYRLRPDELAPAARPDT